jgi:hypothetical protein|tara:strand:+ start:430 stop:585 length:156 start_codon:yes stop_codon:yes gene_type:complete
MLKRMTYTNELKYGYFNFLPSLETCVDCGRLYTIRFSWLWFSLWWDFNTKQ